MLIQSIIMHDSIGKPKIVLDQLREGVYVWFPEEMVESEEKSQCT